MSLANRLAKFSVKTGAVLAGIYVISQASIAMLLGHKVGAELIAMQLAFTKRRFDQIVGNWTAENLIEFQHHFYLDFIHPLWYGLTLAWALAKTLPADRRALVWMPVVAAVCDVCENTLHAIPLFKGRFPDLEQPYIALASTFASVKWLLAAVSVGCVVYYFFRRGHKPAAK